MKTARFILNCAREAKAHTIVVEALDLGKKKRGSKKQRLHHWRARYVQAMVMNKAHRNGLRLSRVLARNTSRLAHDGSGEVTRGTYLQEGRERKNYSICVFQNGKTYNCDLNAALNIGARYYIREIIKPLSETARSGMEAKVPSCRARATCTLSTLISLNAVLAA